VTGADVSIIFVPALGADDIEVEDVGGFGPELRDFDLLHVAQKGVVLQGVAVPGLVPAVDVAELGLEHDGLDGVEAAVDALDLMDILLDRPMAGKQPGVPGEFVVVGNDRSAVPVGAEVLSGVEAECPGDSESPGGVGASRGGAEGPWGAPGAGSRIGPGA